MATISQGVALLPPNGFPPAKILKLTTDIQQFDKVLKLRDDVVAGIHPRIKLGGADPQVNGNVVSTNGVPSNPVAQLNAADHKSNGLPGLSFSINSPQLQQPLAIKESSQREKLEHEIENAGSKKKPEPGERSYHQDILAGFDVTDVFYQAQDAVESLPRAGNQAPTRTTSPNSDTFYSSGVPTEESVDQHNTKTTRPCPFFFEKGHCLKGDRCNWSHDPAFKQQLQKSGNDAQNKSRAGYTSHGGRIRESPTYNNVEDGEVANESPYSPSMNIAIEDVPLPNQQPNNNRPRSPRNEGRQNGRYSPRGKDTQVVRNHITSPIAPQPSRVSPLAVAKVSRFDKGPNEYNRNNGRNQRPPSRNQRPPSGPSSNPRSKKRRRDTEVMDTGRNVAPRTTLASPEPYIKPEPLSPPPMATIPQPIRRVSGMMDQSPRFTDRPAYELVDDYDRGAPRPIVVQSQGHRRVISGSGPAPEPRRQQDLRRIVSTRNLERPLSPLVYVDSPVARTPIQYESPRIQVQPSSYRASIAPQHPTYIVDDRPASPAIQVIRRPEPEVIPRTIAKEDIVMDEFGNRYLRMIAPEPPRYGQEDRRPAMETMRASVRPEPRYVEERIYQDGGTVFREEPRMEWRYQEERVLPRGSVAPEARYYAEPPRPAQQPLLVRGSVRPEAHLETSPRYRDERPRDIPESIARASVQPEPRPQVLPPRYYQETPRQGHSMLPPRASVHPQAEAVFINPKFEQMNVGGRPADRIIDDRPRYEERYAPRAASPAPTRMIDHRASVAPSSRAVYASEPGYRPRQEFVRPSGTYHGLIPEAESRARIAESANGRMSVRPIEDTARRPLPYIEQGYRASVEPEAYRYQEVRREPQGHLPARVDVYGRQEVMEPPPVTQSARPAYRYPSTARDAPPAARPYGGDVYMD